MRRGLWPGGWIILVGGVLAGGAVWVWRDAQPGGVSPAPLRSAQVVERSRMDKEVVATVRTVLIQNKPITEDLTVYGTGIPAPGAIQAVSVPFESQVRQVLVSSGQRVAAHEKLLEISPSPDTQLQIEEARLATQSATQSLLYVQQRLTLKLATNDQVLQAQQALQDAQLRLQSLERRGIANDGVLRAGTAGLIQSVAVQEGAILPAGSPFLELVAQDRLEVRLGVEPEDLDQLQPTQPVALVSINRPAGREVSGKIRKISRAVNPTTRLIDVFVTLPASADFLLDEYIRGRIAIASTQGLVVPRSVVLPEDDRYVLFTVHNGRAKKHQIQIGIENDQEVQVLSAGLQPNDQAVILGNYELQDGMAVQVEPTA